MLLVPLLTLRLDWVAARTPLTLRTLWTLILNRSRNPSRLMLTLVDKTFGLLLAAVCNMALLLDIDVRGCLLFQGFIFSTLIMCCSSPYQPMVLLVFIIFPLASGLIGLLRPIMHLLIMFGVSVPQVGNGILTICHNYLHNAYGCAFSAVICES